MRSGGGFFRIVLVLAQSCLCIACDAAAEASAANFAGMRVALGETVRADVPLSAPEQQYATEGGNASPAHAVAVLAVPPGFNPKKSWPVLVVFSTDDFKRLNRDDLADFYRTDALAEGWVVLAGDGPEYPRRGTSGWRAAMTLAALDALHRSFPGSERWPVACAGYSGGAKQTGLLAPLLAVAGVRVVGIYLTGINVDRLSEGYRQFRPGNGFLHTPVFISSGQSDKVATLQAQWDVMSSIKKTGFDRVRMEMFREGHVVKRAHLRAALQWFAQLRAAP